VINMQVIGDPGLQGLFEDTSKSFIFQWLFYLFKFFFLVFKFLSLQLCFEDGSGIISLAQSADPI
jgi:hypothetical protein